ncbi:MAG: transcriptional regulator [Nitrospinae bacterium]|nr:transcriptional regulator [Nitrospinota bacterium]
MERQETVRKDIIARLEERTLSAKEISGAVGVREREVYEHLEHIKKSLERGESRLKVQPAECKKCGFTFQKRERMKKPGKCPICRGQSIAGPFFYIG